MGLFGWLNPEAEPEDSALVEITDDQGTHIVVTTPTRGDALDVEGMLRRQAGARSEPRARGDGTERDSHSRNENQLWVRSARVAPHGEDLEPEEDDDSITEPDEQAAEGGWFSWW